MNVSANIYIKMCFEVCFIFTKFYSLTYSGLKDQNMNTEERRVRD